MKKTILAILALTLITAAQSKASMNSLALQSAWTLVPSTQRASITASLNDLQDYSSRFKHFGTAKKLRKAAINNIINKLVDAQTDLMLVQQVIGKTQLDLITKDVNELQAAEKASDLAKVNTIAKTYNELIKKI